ncbi:lamin tail domain-containing protein [Halorussus gelatinilyticus]|uniref:Lamin tail domain-containing protein n=1 Tax=Halorussus gelatinilyticus TaxID=2937524 RepID=A0A8U0IHG2_9EURY|nr:lamin tail domain-containing protein [Halorussus gelatinilyticus]UPW00126.1 lamin tail domain-containing protein [Halorussus gelatinilyticus]
MGVSNTNPWTTRTTTDHDAIREWVEARDAEPAHAPRTAEGVDLGDLRLDFPEDGPDANLEPVAWDDFFGKFESADLAFEYQNEEQNGERSYFHRFVNREETGVTEAPDAAVSVVAVETVSEVTDANETEEPSGERDHESPDTDPARGPSAEGVPDEVLGNRRQREPRLTAALVVDEIHENARGYDHWDKNGEYVVLRNEGDEPLDLTGWSVANSDEETYEFPDEFVLDPKRSVTIHSGSGEDTDRHLYWGSPLALWKNTGDVLTVRDDTDRRVIRVSY